MSLVFRSLVDGAKRLSPFSTPPPASPASFTTASAVTELFPVTTAEVDGEDCTHDCENCHVSYPRGFKIDEEDPLYGKINGWSTHVLVATGKTDWVRDVADEKGSVMQALAEAEKPSNGKMMVSASNMPTPKHTSDYAEPTVVVLLPAFVVVENVTPAAVPGLVEGLINIAPTNTSPLAPRHLPRTLSGPRPGAEELVAKPFPRSALILLCSQKTRDARCGQSAPLLRRELERHLRPLGLFRDLDDDRPGGVGVYFISHVGGHKYSANVLVYRRANAFGVDGVNRAQLAPGEELKPVKTAPTPREPAGSTSSPACAEAVELGEKGGTAESDLEEYVGAAQCIWLARVKPEDCENLIRYTVLQGKVVKPETQLRGGFDRGKGLMSW